MFLYGMKVMSDALMELAGDRMRSILSTTTSNRLFAVLTGFTITAVIQSSSATTLMVVSFANANLLTLSEAIGVIMGANIGTTFTGQLIAFKLTDYSLGMLALGFLVRAVLKPGRGRELGSVIVGLGLLFSLLGRGASAVFRRRCVRCGKPVARGATYCADHLKQSVEQARDKAHHERGSGL